MPLPYPWVSVQPLFTGRSGTPFSATGERQYTQVFRVVVADKKFGTVAVGAAPGVTKPFAPYVALDAVEYDLLALCVKISAKQEYDDDWKNWLVTCDYSTVLPRGGAPEFAGYPNLPGRQGSSNNPELEPPDISWDFEIVQKAPATDLDGNAFVNSAWTPYKPAPTFEYGYPVLSITRNELSFDIKKAKDYAFTVNDKDFLGAPPETVLCYPPSAKLTFRGPISYNRVSYRLKFNTFEYVEYADDGETALETKQETWQLRLLDAGTMSWNKLEFRQEPISAPGIPHVHEPVLLDKDGQPAKPDPNSEFGFIPEYYNDFRVYRKKDFTSLIVNGLG